MLSHAFKQVEMDSQAHREGGGGGGGGGQPGPMSLNKNK